MATEEQGSRRAPLFARLRRRARPEAGEEPDLRTLEERVEHLEAALQGLEDATHRQIVRHDERLEELAKQLQPQRIAQALSRDARQRGL